MNSTANAPSRSRQVPSIDEVVLKMGEYLTSPDEKLVRSAYEFANSCHEGQKRASGQPYIIHPLRVAKILTEMKMDSAAIAAGLLHDVVEDCGVPLATIEKRYGLKIAKLVDGVTKLEHFKFESKKQASLENFRKMFLIMAEHVRVVFIKLADRLDNMRTLEHLPDEARKRIAKETLEIYAPLSERLGMGVIRGELADLAFKHLMPEEYAKTRSELEKARRGRERHVKVLMAKITRALKGQGIDMIKIEGRPKTVYSTFQKLKRTDDVDKVYDLLAIRIITTSKDACYKVLGIIHSLYKPVPGTFKDYIAVAKPNGYQSLHTAIFGEKGEITEVQIRTEKMHEEAEGGLAAHWYYQEIKDEKTKKYRDTRSVIKTPEERLSWIKALSDWQRNVTDPEFEEIMKIDVFKHRILVFSPQGDIFDLPADATPVDFAYAVHSEIGNRATGAKVNGRIVTLDSNLNNRDVVDILTSKRASGPSRDWLNFVKTSMAKNHIKGWFKRQNRDTNLKAGKRILEEEIAKISRTETPKSLKNFDAIAKELNLRAEDDLYAAVGEGSVTTGQVMKKLFASAPPIKRRSAAKPVRPSEQVVFLGADKIKISYGTCCKPKLGVPIVGYTTRGRGVTVHALKCKNVPKLEPDRLVSVAWDLGTSVIVPVKIVGRNRVGFLRDITSHISGMGINITNVATNTTDAGLAEVTMTLELADAGELLDVFRKLKLISDIKEVTRI